MRAVHNNSLQADVPDGPRPELKRSASQEVRGEFVRTLIPAIFSLVLTGCFAQSDVPLRAETGPKFDARLIGVWELSGDGEHVYVHIGTSDGDGKMIVVEHKEDGELSIEEYPFVAACITSGCYMSIRMNTNEPGYALLGYSLAVPKTLTVSHPNLDVLKLAVSSGKIGGEVHEKTLAEAVDIHATEVELRNFMESYGQKVFPGESMSLQKIR